MKFSRAILLLIATLILLLLIILLGAGDEPSPETNLPTSNPSASPIATVAGEATNEESSPEDPQHMVERVIDGDTLVLKSGETVRLIGIDAPEKGKECLSEDSKAKLEELVLNKNIRLEKDVSEDDRFDRLLRYIWVEDLFVNKTLVEEGFAASLRYPPDVKHQAELQEAERIAKEKKWGIWNELCALPTPTPAPTKTPASTPAATTAPKNPTPAPTVAATQTTQPTSAQCSSNTYNCSDFSTCNEAKEVLAACSTDVHKLDQDGDGIPCESLCK